MTLELILLQLSQIKMRIFLDMYDCSLFWVGFPHPVCWETGVLILIYMRFEILAGDLAGRALLVC